MTESMINFGPGPAKLPHKIIEKIEGNLYNWEGTGLSILEIGHRSRAFQALVEKMVSSVKRLLSVPDHYAIIFLPAGAQNQFAMCNMNLVGAHSTVNYLETGYWSKKAIAEAKKYANVHIVASSAERNFFDIPHRDSWRIDADGAFLHFTDNETIGGLEFPEKPDGQGLFLVSDMSSNIFSRPIDFHNYGCIYACAQKNFGISGMSLVIIREDLLDKADPQTPAVFNYKLQWQSNSLLATPPTFAFYVASLMFDWIEENGGVDKFDQLAKQKAQLLYNYIDQSMFYHNKVDKRHRSRMNVPFTLSDNNLTDDFIQQATNVGLANLKGHRSVGGARASIYNAMSLAEVQRLVLFMKEYEQKNG